MSSYLSRLNPAERRAAIIAGLVVFVIANALYVWPHFSDWGNLRTRLNLANQTYTDHETVIQQAARLEPEMAKLRREGGDVPPLDQALEFLRTVQMQANQSGVNFLRNSSPHTATNQFFLDQSQTISVQGGEKQLVDFLYSLGAGTSMIRVRSLSVRPDSSRQQLSADITLVASYQRSLPKRSAAATPAPAAVKPAVPAAPKPGIPATVKPAAPPASNPTTPPLTPPAGSSPKKKDNRASTPNK